MNPSMPCHLGLQFFHAGPCELNVRIEFEGDFVETDGLLLMAEFSEVGPDIGIIYRGAGIQLYNPFKAGY